MARGTRWATISACFRRRDEALRVCTGRVASHEQHRRHQASTIPRRSDTRSHSQGRRPFGAPGGGVATAAGEARARVLRRRSEEHTSELQSRQYLVCRLLLEKKERKIKCVI